MRVAVVTDNDFSKLNGVTTTLRALIRHTRGDVHARIYTFGSVAADEPGSTCLSSDVIPIPFHSERKMYLPRLRALRDRLRADDTNLIHLTTPGPAGLAARWLADSLRVPLIGSYHPELADDTTFSSGSRALGRAMDTYMRWLYGACGLVMVPSVATRERLIERGWRSDQLVIWSRGVDCEQFSPSRRSEALRRQWGVSDPGLVVLYAGRLSKEKGLGILRRIQHVLAAHGVAHRFVLAGEGPMTAELREVLPDAVFTGSRPACGDRPGHGVGRPVPLAEPHRYRRDGRARGPGIGAAGACDRQGGPAGKHAAPADRLHLPDG